MSISNFKIRKKINDDRLNVAARVEREKLASRDTQTEADGSEPLVEGMANLKVKTLNDYQTPQEPE